MTLRSILSILTFFSLLTIPFFTSGQTSNGLMFDTSKTAIIKFNKKSGWPFDSTFKAATLTQIELQLVDSFLLVCVTDYNNSLDKDHKQWGIDVKNRNYRKQLIVVTNKKGKKEVWVNCFCNTTNYPWKSKIYAVEDGGNCFFDFKINLTINKYYDLAVNGI